MSSFGDYLKFINKDSEIEIYVKHESGVTLAVKIQHERGLTVTFRHYFSRHGTTISGEDLDPEIMNLVITNYAKQISVRVSKDPGNFSVNGNFVTSIKKIYSNILDRLKSPELMPKLLKMFLTQSRSMDIYSSDEYSGKIFARTSVELDGDILNIINPDFTRNSAFHKAILSIHMINAGYASTLYYYPLLFSITVIRRMFPVFRWALTLGTIIPGGIISYSSLLNPDAIYFLAPVLTGILSSLFYYLTPRVLRYIISRRIIESE
jgi:hypothetical protein